MNGSKAENIAENKKENSSLILKSNYEPQKVSNNTLLYLNYYFLHSGTSPR
jgi:hypothetical protein